MTSPELAIVLAGQREELNRIFRQQALLHPQVRAEEFLPAFGRLAQAAVDSLGRDARYKETAGSVVKILFQISLELAGRGMLGPGRSGLGQGLESLMASFPGPLAHDPDRFLRSAANAMTAVLDHSEDSLAKWLKLMERLNGVINGIDEFLKAGLVAAWISGLAQYRASALRTMGELSGRALAGLFDISEGTPPLSGDGWAKIMSADPWAEPQMVLENKSREQACFTTAGGYLGFGGPFHAPPRLAADAEGGLALDGQAAYRIFTDRYGTFLYPEPGVDPDRETAATQPNFSLFKEGIRVGTRHYPVEEMVSLGRVGLPLNRADLPASSAILLKNTLFFTHPLSYRIFIVGLPGEIMLYKTTILPAK